MRLRARNRSRLSRGPAPAAGGAWSPASLPDVELWLRADLGVTMGAGAGEVAAWASQVGTAVASFRNPDTMPQLVSVGLGGEPQIGFAFGSGMITDYVPPAGAAPRGFFAVTSDVIVNGHPIEHVFHYGAMNTRQAYGLTFSLSFTPDVGNHYWADALSSGVAPSSGGSVLVAAYDGADDRILIDGVEVARRTVALNTGTVFPLYIASRIGGGETSMCRLSEFVAMASDPSDEDVAAFMAYATARYGI